ncbi:site-specific recombinase XerD [Frondihabitans sp. PhB188]|nr:site-specific recombinase XerD [Frondihabitans sp. PhB188]
MSVDSIASSTRAAYERALRSFSHWLEGGGWDGSAPKTALEPTSPRPPRIVLAYLTEMSNQVLQDGSWRYSSGTIRQALAAINWAHTRTGAPLPGDDVAVREAMRQIQLERPALTHSRAIGIADVRKLLEGIQSAPDAASIRAARDRCLILFNFAGALLVQELLAVQTSDVSVDESGDLIVEVPAVGRMSRRESRSVQLVKGTSPATCPACAFAQWAMRRRGRSLTADFSGDVHFCEKGVMGTFRSGLLFPSIDRNGQILDRSLERHLIGAMLRRRALEAGMDPHALSPTALRLGFMAEAIRANISLSDLADHSGQRDLKSLQSLAARMDLRGPRRTISLGL